MEADTVYKGGASLCWILGQSPTRRDLQKNKYIEKANFKKIKTLFLKFAFYKNI